MPDHPLRVLESLDPKPFRLAEDTRRLALSDGDLPRKFKLLIALALDATHGAVDGVKSLAQAAMQAGATKDEVAEAFRVAQYISGGEAKRDGSDNYGDSEVEGQRGLCAGEIRQDFSIHGNPVCSLGLQPMYRSIMGRLRL